MGRIVTTTSKKVEVGMVFGSLTVTSKTTTSKNGHSRWICLCKCGETSIVKGIHLNSGHTQSCGCRQRSRAAEAQNRHGMCGTSEYRIWALMVGRCRDPSSTSYRNYGARGIRVCDRWMDFMNFFADMGHRPSLKHSLDRIDNDGDYAPENCRWATQKEQMRNTRINRMISFSGITMALVAWCEFLGVPYGLVCSRISRGYSFVDAVTTPKGIRGVPKETRWEEAQA